MTSTPYSDLPDHCFWRRSHSGAPGSVDPVVKAAFRISPADRLASAGSCFAQNIAGHLVRAGLRYFITETAHPLAAKHADGFNYGTFSARYGNIYTAAQLRQLIDRAFGDFTPFDDIWTGNDGHYYDPFRPLIQPGGFASRAEYDADRLQHFAAVRRLVKQANVFIVTLGLTEAWRARSDGAVYPICPGAAAGTYDPEEHEFVNFTVNDTVRDLSQFIRGARRRNPGLKFIFTVSPVPLIATAVDRSVIESTVYSKSVLRVAAEMMTKKFEDVAYFPSYEIITGPGARGRYFGEDCREVRPEGVQHVMRLFLKHYAGIEALPNPSAERAPKPADATIDYEALTRDIEILCDEEILAVMRKLSG